jgi:hypothetical protein
MTPDLDTLLTALHVKIDDELKGLPWPGVPRSPPTPTGSPWASPSPCCVTSANAAGEIGEREVLEAMLHRDADLIASRTDLVLISGKGFSGRDLEQLLAERHIALLCPARKKEKERWGAAILKKIRQLDQRRPRR